MIRIEPRQPPPVVALVRASGGSFRALSSESAVRGALFDEQGGRCAYCERRLRDPRDGSDHRTRIEHYHPQHPAVNGPGAPKDAQACLRASGAPSIAAAPTAWSNLLLCCDGEEHAPPANRHCDVRKGNVDICHEFRNPKNATRARILDVSARGRVGPATGMPPGAARVVDVVLGLNTPTLVRAREQVFGALMREIAASKRRHRGMTPARRQELRRKIEAQIADADFPSTLLAAADAAGL